MEQYAMTYPKRILNNGLDPITKFVFLVLVSLAQKKNVSTDDFNYSRGSVYLSLEKLSDITGLALSTLKKHLKILAEKQMIKRYSNICGTIINISNYDYYSPSNIFPKKNKTNEVIYFAITHPKRMLNNNLEPITKYVFMALVSLAQKRSVAIDDLNYSRGSVYLLLEKLSDITGLCVNALKKHLNILSDKQMIERKSSSSGTIINIFNFDYYSPTSIPSRKKDKVNEINA